MFFTFLSNSQPQPSRRCMDERETRLPASPTLISAVMSALRFSGTLAVDDRASLRLHVKAAAQEKAGHVGRHKTGARIRDSHFSLVSVALERIYLRTPTQGGCDTAKVDDKVQRDAIHWRNRLREAPGIQRPAHPALGFDRLSPSV